MSHREIALAEAASVPRRQSGSKPIIVVIEDDYRSALALVMLMEDWGYTCVAGRSAREVAQVLGSRLTHISAIVADLNLQGAFRGIQDAKSLVLAIGRAVPTIVTTGYADFANQASDFPVLRKPFEPNMLRAWLEYKLGQ